ncbi:MAG TPA: hypothetical protein VNR89_19485 [Roseomonas sp.]|nr:hypothetical protein [Roseomonas sp.]
MRVHGPARGACCALALLLAGCATWVKPGATEADGKAVLAQCRARAEAELPALRRTEIQRPGYWVPSRTECGPRQTGCSTSSSYFQPPVYRDYDPNGALRETVIETCMQDQGWSLEGGL